jgi:hypothetical protein
MYQRHILGALRDALSDSPVVLVNGARQTGKSTLVKAFSEGERPAAYVTLDDATVLSAASGDPAGFLAGFRDPVVIDEIQRVPDLFRAIKVEVDRARTPGRFLLTGSANVFLLPRVGESLAGRMEILTLWPLSQGEMEGRQERFVDALFSETPSVALTVKGAGDRRDVIQRVLRGGYPEAVSRAAGARRDAWFGAYLNTILQRDVRDLAHIEGLTELPRLLSLMAARTASLLNMSELSRSSGMAQTTLKRYLALLETTFLVHRLPAWSRNLGKRLVRAPKVFINDAGLAAYLIGVDETRLTRNATLLGALLENFVVMELRKQVGWSRTRVTLFHFRTQTGQEVDVVLETPDGRLAGVEVKAGATVDAGDFKGLRVLSDAAGESFACGVVLYTGTNTVAFGDRLYAVPIAALWHA